MPAPVTTGKEEAITSSLPAVTVSSSQPNPHRVRDERLRQLLAGGFGGVVNTLLFYPLDVIKTRMQVDESTRPRRQPMLQALRAGGLFRGLNASLLALVPNWALYWLSYEEFKQLGGGGHSPLLHTASAVGAGFVTAVATSPLWVIRTRMQLEIGKASQAKEYGTVRQSIRKIVHDEGFLALYKGLAPTLLGLVHVAVQFPLYENIKARLARSQHRKAAASPLALAGDESASSALGLSAPSTRDVVIASSISKALASLVAYPHEVVRSRLQNRRGHVHGSYDELRELLTLLRSMVRNEGLASFYKGAVPNLLKTVPSTVVTFTSYEFAKLRLEEAMS